MASIDTSRRQGARKLCVQHGACLNTKVVAITRHLDFRTAHNIQMRLAENYLSQFPTDIKSRIKALNRYFKRASKTSRVLSELGVRDFCLECSKN